MSSRRIANYSKAAFRLMLVSALAGCSRMAEGDCFLQAYEEYRDEDARQCLSGLGTALPSGNKAFVNLHLSLMESVNGENQANERIAEYATDVTQGEFQDGNSGDEIRRAAAYMALVPDALARKTESVRLGLERICPASAQDPVHCHLERIGFWVDHSANGGRLSNESLYLILLPIDDVYDDTRLSALSIGSLGIFDPARARDRLSEEFRGAPVPAIVRERYCWMLDWHRTQDWVVPERSRYCGTTPN